MPRLNVCVVAVLSFGAQMLERWPMRIGEIFSMPSGEALVGRRETSRGEGIHQHGKGKRR